MDTGEYVSPKYLNPSKGEFMKTVFDPVEFEAQLEIARKELSDKCLAEEGFGSLPFASAMLTLAYVKSALQKSIKEIEIG